MSTSTAAGHEEVDVKVQSAPPVVPRAPSLSLPTTTARAAAIAHETAETPKPSETADEKIRETKEAVRPVRGERNVLVTSALPYVNNVPHLGNIIGCVLSADVYARFCRLRGYNTLFVCGSDAYGTATETKAVQEGVTPEQLCRKYHALHEKIYSWFYISFDHFGRTNTPVQTEIAQEIFAQCAENKCITEGDENQPWCHACKRFLPDRFVEGECPACKFGQARGDQCDGCGKLLELNELVRPRCKLCSASPLEIRSSRHLFLDLPAVAERVDKWFQRSSDDGQWTANSVQITRAWLAAGLCPRSITRDLSWGTPVPTVPSIPSSMKDKVFYCWFDAPIGYISITAEYDPKAWREWWLEPSFNVQLYQFMGKDNVPFHSIMFPATLLATNRPYTLAHHINSCEYLNYENVKFSKSRGTGVFGDDVMQLGLPADLWRYYLIAVRPETGDTVFSWKQFADCVNNELLPNLGNLVHRVTSFLQSAFGGVVPRAPDGADVSDDDRHFVEAMAELTKEYVGHLEAVRLRDGQRCFMKMAAAANRYLQHTQPFRLVKTGQKAAAGRILWFALHAIRWIAVCCQPFIPGVSASICRLLSITLPPHALATPLFDPLADVAIFGKDHHLPPPVCLFKPFDPALRDALQSRFSGMQPQTKQT